MKKSIPHLYFHVSAITAGLLLSFLFFVRINASLVDDVAAEEILTYDVEPCDDPNNMDPVCIEHREWEACMDPANMDPKCVEMRQFEACKADPTSTDPKCIEMRQYEACQDPNNMDQMCVDMRRSIECDKNPTSTDPFCLQHFLWQRCQDPSYTASECNEIRKVQACKADPASMDPFCVEMRKAEECRLNPSSTAEFCVNMRKAEECKNNPDSTDQFCLDMKTYEKCKQDESDMSFDCKAVRISEHCKNNTSDPVCQVLKENEACKDDENHTLICEYLYQWIECAGYGEADPACAKAKLWDDCVRRGDMTGVQCIEQVQIQLSEKSEREVGSPQEEDSASARTMQYENIADQQIGDRKYSEIFQSSRVELVKSEKPALARVEENELEHIPLDRVRNIRESEELQFTEVEIEKLRLTDDSGSDEPPREAGLMVLRGKGPADSTVQIHVYSDPIVMTTKTDQNGDWVYTLDSSVEEGRHEAYVTVSDENDQPVIRSSFFEFFVSEAVAVTSDMPGTEAADNKDSNRAMLAVFGIAAVVMIGLTAFVLLYVFSAPARKANKERLQQDLK